MLTPSDKELDRLSREAAEQFEPDENISSWEKLQARLDTDLGKPPSIPQRRFGRGPIGYTAVIAVVATISILIYKQYHNSAITEKTSTLKSTVVSDQAKSSRSSAVGNAGNSASGAANSGEALSEAANPGSTTSKSDPNATERNSSTATIGSNNKKQAPGLATGIAPIVSAEPSGTAATSNKSTTANHQETAKTGSSKSNDEIAGVPNENGQSNAGSNVPNHQSASAQKGKGHGKGAILVPSVGLAASQPGTTLSTGNNGQVMQSTTSASNGVDNKTTSGNAMITRDPTKSQIQGKANISQTPNVYHSVSDASAASMLPGPGATASKSKSRSLHLSRPLSIGVMYAPDMTTASGTAPEKLSANVGLSLGYYFTNNLSINTGLIYTKKNYSAAGDKFHLPWNPGWGYELDFVKGNCYMFEIPLSLRYDFDAGGKTVFFVTGGASSYLMKEENYTYYAHGTDASGRPVYYPPYDASYDNHTNYFFSVIGISAGVETKLSKSLSLQVEPFIKLPVKGVGYGNLNLSSYGISLSLRLAPLLGASRR